MLSSYHFSKNIEFLTHDNYIISSKNVTQNVNATKNRPLLIILAWLMSKQRHVMKFVNLYMEQGFDVVVVSLTPWQLLWPTKGSKVSDTIALYNMSSLFTRPILFKCTNPFSLFPSILDCILILFENKKVHNF